MYFQDGDFVTFYFADDEAYEDRADGLVTLYRSFETGNLVGCKIKGVKRILAKLGNFGVAIQDGDAKVMLWMLFIGAALVSPSTASQKDSEELSRQYGALPVDNLPRGLAA